MDDIFIRYSTITDSLIKAGYKQVMQVLANDCMNRGVQTFWANGSRLIRVCSKDMFCIHEIEWINTEETIITFCTSIRDFMNEFEKNIIGSDSEEFPSVLEIFDDILYGRCDKVIDKKLKINKALSDYPELREVFGNAYSDDSYTPTVKLNLYDFYKKNDTNSIGYVIAVDNDGFLFQETSGVSELRYYALSELDNMTPLPDMRNSMRTLLHNTMCAFRDFLEYSRVVERLNYIGYTNIGSILDMNNSYDFSDCSVGFKSEFGGSRYYVQSPNLLVDAIVDSSNGYFTIKSESRNFTEVSSEVILESVEPRNYLDIVKVVATQILIKFAPALVDNDETVKYLDDLVCALLELDEIDVDPNLQWGDMKKSTAIKQNLQGILNRASSFED